MFINFLMNYYLYKNFEKILKKKYINFEKNLLNDSKIFFSFKKKQKVIK